MPAFIELCAGMAGVSMRLAGRNRLVKYRGGKWKLAKDIIDIGGITTPSRYVWAEANPHARRFLKTFSDTTVSSEAVEVLKSWVREGPEAMLARWWRLSRVFTKLEPLDVSDAEHCAAFFMWRQVEGMRCMPYPQLIGLKLGNSAVKDDLVKPTDWIIHKMMNAAENFVGMHAEVHDDARSIEPFKDAVVYLDPPYVGTQGYSENDMSRECVINLARSWGEVGAQVMISEGEPIHDLVNDGWYTVQLSSRGCFNPGTWDDEWLTTNREPWPADFTGW